MSVRRRLALGGGVAAAVLGLALAVDPALGPDLSVDEAVVVVVGTVALLYAGSPLHRRWATGRQRTPDPDPETPTTPGPPGDDLDRLLAAAGSTNPRTADRRHRLRTRLLDAATTAVGRHEECDAETARELLAEGDWTDDPLVASYFTPGPIEVADADLPLARRVQLRVSSRSRRAYAARRVADEVAALTDPEASSSTGLDGSSPADPDESAPTEPAGADDRTGDAPATGPEGPRSMAELEESR